MSNLRQLNLSVFTIYVRGFVSGKRAFGKHASDPTKFLIFETLGKSCSNNVSLIYSTESDHAKPLRKYFTAISLSRISADAILAYIRLRKEKGISNVTINMEVGILRRVLKRAKRWAAVADDIPDCPNVATWDAL